MGGLNPDTTEQRIFNKLNEIHTARNVRLVINKRTGLSKCFAFFDVPNAESMRRYLEPAEDFQLDGRPLFFQKANTSESEKAENTQKRVYIKNLPRNPCIEDLTSIFKKFGKVRSAYQIKDKFKRLQDYGFVDFINAADAKKLLKLGSINIDGRLICFSPYKKAKSKEAQPSETKSI